MNQKDVDSAEKRAAVDMSVKLSTQLIATAVGMLTVEGALLVYAVTYREPGGTVFLFALLSALCFVLSIHAAGKGITISRDRGFAGQWDLECSRIWFNRQAGGGVFGLLCLIVTLVCILLSSTRSDGLVGNVAKLQTEVIEQKNNLMRLANLSSQVELQRTELEIAKQEIKTLNQIIDKLEREKQVKKPYSP